MAIYMMRENTYTYSYDFRNKTTSQITSDGWTLLTWSLNVNSNWILWNSNEDCRLAHTIPSLATAKRIIISGTFIGSTNSLNATSFMVGYGSWWGTSATWSNYQWSSYAWIKVFCKTNWTTASGNVVGYITATNTYKPTITIDLENKLVTWVISWFSNSTYSLSDTQVNDIRNNYTQLIPYVSVNHTVISDISIDVE